MIEIEHLNKTYPSPTGDIHALRDVDLRIDDGAVSYTHLTLPTKLEV